MIPKYNVVFLMKSYVYSCVHKDSDNNQKLYSSKKHEQQIHSQRRDSSGFPKPAFSSFPRTLLWICVPCMTGSLDFISFSV